MTPPSPLVNQEASAEVTVLSGVPRQPVRNATFDIEAHMSHPGMAPVVRRTSDDGNGVYGARLQFPMSGDWVVFVTGTMPGGQAIRHRTAEFTVRLPE